MLVYLSKKISIPNNVRLHCIAWNKKEGYIAVGGENGLLKVIRADSNITMLDATTNIKGRSMINNLSMNQTLEGHKGCVQVVTWNEEHQKLTSSDENGVIIVWMMYKGSWYEEMINNRNKSIVKGMSWSSNGEKICIVYEDGAVIVGSVEGNRIWGKELKDLSLTSVEWSPDAKFLLFGSRNGEAHFYDDQGVFLTKKDNISDGLAQAIVALEWYNGKNGYATIDCPTLAVCFQNGKIYLLKDICDDNLIKIDTNMSITCCVWNTFGSVIAIAGKSVHQEKKDINLICFYSVFGEYINTLKVPGKEVNCCSWEDGSLRLSLSSDSNIYFANIRPNYKWAYFGNTIVFSDERVGKNGVCITFWNTTTNTCYFKYVKSLIDIAAQGEHCVLAVRNNFVQGKQPFVLLVCNAISTPIDKKLLDFEPKQITMNNNLVIIANKNNFYLWNFLIPRNSSVNIDKLRKERWYHIDDTPTGVIEVIQDLEENKYFVAPANRTDSSDPISSINATDKILLIARESGVIQQYSLPQVTLIKRYNIIKKPYKLAINCDSTIAAVIDKYGVLRLLKLWTCEDYDQTNEIITSVKNSKEYASKFERKDVWAMCWAEDNSQLLALFEKSRMYVFRGFEPEEPISCSGYPCYFRDLEIRCILLDKLMQRPADAGSEFLQNLEVKSLRDTRDLLARVGLRETEEFICDNPHPRLWRLLGEHALRRMELETAENAMVRCADYLGIRFIKRLHGIHDPGLRYAEILAFLGDFDEAEQAYLELDRRDLAVSLRQKLADYPRAVQLMQFGVGSSDIQLEQTHARWGKLLAAQQEWRAAREHLERGGALECLLECYYRLEEYDQLAITATQLTAKTLELRRAARMLASIGMCYQAVECYIRCTDIRQAVETCVRSNRWKKALELAHTWKLPGINELLAKYAQHLLSRGHQLQVVELYRKANYPLEAAQLLLKLASEQTRAGAAPLRLKKLYLLTAIIAQQQVEKRLLEEDSMEAQIAIEAWRGAEAYHFLLLAHRQLYEAKPKAAFYTALRLCEYEDLLEHERLYALLAFVSYACGALATCSRALLRLETLQPIYEKVSLELFAQCVPQDIQQSSRIECFQCETLIPDYCVRCPNCANEFSACIISGQTLMDVNKIWLCTVCRRQAGLEYNIVNGNGCLFCHSIIRYM